MPESAVKRQPLSLAWLALYRVTFCHFLHCFGFVLNFALFQTPLLILPMKIPFLILLLMPVVALGHSGGLDAQGCHHVRATGEYHCHKTTNRPAPAPAAPEQSASATVIRTDRDLGLETGKGCQDGIINIENTRHLAGKYSMSGCR